MLGAVLAAVAVLTLPPGLDEVSGTAFSGGVLHVQEDSGSEAVVTALAPDGSVLRTIELPGVELVDAEDMAAGPGGALLLADVGDNDADRPSVALVRVAPEGEVERFALTYEDGPRDAETLLVHPRTGQVLLVSKAVFGSGVYAAPVPLADGVLTRVGDLDLGPTDTPGGPGIGAVATVLATGGAVSPDGRRVAVRTYTDLHVYEVPGDDLVEALATPPVVLALPETRQGEAVTWTADGAAVLVTSEGEGAPVQRVEVPAAPAAPEPDVVAAPPDAAPADPAVPVVPLVVGAVLLVCGVAVVRWARRP